MANQWVQQPSADDMDMFSEMCTLTAATIPVNNESEAQTEDGHGIMTPGMHANESQRALMLTAQQLADGECYIISVDSGPYHQHVKRPKRRDPYLAQAFMCTLVDNQCEQPYQRKQYAVDHYGSRGIPTAILSAYLDLAQVLFPPAEMHGLPSVPSLRPGAHLRTAHLRKPYLPRLEANGVTLQCGDAVEFTLNSFSFSTGLGRIVNFWIRPRALLKGPFQPFNPLGQIPQSHNMWVEVVRLFRGSDVSAIGTWTCNERVTNIGECMRSYQVLEGPHVPPDSAGSHSADNMVPFRQVCRALQVHTADIFDRSMCATGCDVQVIGSLGTSRSNERSWVRNLDLGTPRAAACDLVQEIQWGLRGVGFDRDIAMLRDCVAQFIRSKSHTENSNTLQWVLCSNCRWESVIIAAHRAGFLHEDNVAVMTFRNGVHRLELADIQLLEIMLQGQFRETHLGAGLGTLLLDRRAVLSTDLAKPGRVLVAFEHVVRMHHHGLGAQFDTDNNVRKSNKYFRLAPRAAAALDA